MAADSIAAVKAGACILHIHVRDVEGKSHMPMMLAGLTAGCNNLRVGPEDNVFLKKGEYATNVQLVAGAAQLGVVAGRDIATAAEAREILGIQKNW